MAQDEQTYERLNGRELAELRRNAGLTQSQLARAAGIGRHAVSYWEQKSALDGRQHAPRRMLAVLGVRIVRAVFAETNARARGYGVLELERAAIARLEARYATRAQENARLQQLLRQVRCEARTRKGLPCRLPSEPGRCRCKFHGGRSTGPKTPEGRARVAEAQRRRWLIHRMAQQVAKSSAVVDDGHPPPAGKRARHEPEAHTPPWTVDGDCPLHGYGAVGEARRPPD